MSLKFSILFLILAFSVSAFGQKKKDKTSLPIVDVNFCDLIEKPDDYVGKTVRVKASFEIYEGEPRIVCGDCLDIEAISIKFGDGSEKAAKKIYRKPMKEKTLANVIFVGKFAVGGFGKDNRYTKQIIVESVEYAEVLADKPNNYTIRMQAKDFCQKKD